VNAATEQVSGGAASSRTFLALPGGTAFAYGVLMVAAVCVYLALWPSAPVVAGDSNSYLRAAQALSGAHTDRPNDRAPGYPLFLILTSSVHSPGRTLFMASLGLHLLSVWLLAIVLHRLGVAERTLRLFAIVLLLPPYVEPAAYVLTENLTEAALAVGFAGFALWLLAGSRAWLVASSLAFGYAGLTRPTYQLLAPALAAYLALANLSIARRVLAWTKWARASATIVLGSLVLIGGFAFVNYRTVGQFSVSPVLGLALTQKTIRVVERLPDEYSDVRRTLVTARNAALLSDPRHLGSSYIESTIPELMAQTGLSKAQLSGFLMRLNLILIERAPAEFLHELVWAFGSYWFPASSPLANMNSRFLQFAWGVVHVAIVGAFGVVLILLSGALPCLQAIARSSRRLLPERLRSAALLYGFGCSIVFYTAAISCVVQDGTPRYRVPTDALILFLAFAGLRLWRTSVRLVVNNFA
jgi:hypothetical protein